MSESSFAMSSFSSASHNTRTHNNSELYHTNLETEPPKNEQGGNTPLNRLFMVSEHPSTPIAATRYRLPHCGPLHISIGLAAMKSDHICTHKNIWRKNFKCRVFPSNKHFLNKKATSFSQVPTQIKKKVRIKNTAVKHILLGKKFILDLFKRFSAMEVSLVIALKKQK